MQVAIISDTPKQSVDSVRVYGRKAAPIDLSSPITSYLTAGQFPIGDQNHSLTITLDIAQDQLTFKPNQYTDSRLRIYTHFTKLPRENNGRI